MPVDLLDSAPAVVLAPMAGVTNRAFRRVCREASPDGASIYVAEMTTSQALLRRNKATLDLVRFDDDEQPRSIQLYGVDPETVGAAVRMVVKENMADHIDLNFGCPVPKVTRKGGGSALPWKIDLFAAIVQSAVAAAEDRVPVTVKMRKGIDDEHLTFLEAGQVAADAGVTWVALHGRTAEQYYGGQADWRAIEQLVQAIPGTPVLGNGDIWSGADAAAMLQQTGARGVVVGRGCLGRPWIFGQIQAALSGAEVPPEPKADEVLHWLRRHAELLVAMHDDEFLGAREMRKHMAWYLKGLVVGSNVRTALGLVSSLAEIDELLAQIDPEQQVPSALADTPRGRTTSQRKVSLPEHWLVSRAASAADLAEVREAELDVTGG